MAGPHARAVPCPLCHEKFFPKSLPFHQKQCEKRRAAQRVNCPYCSIEVSALELPSHISVCPRGQPKRPGQGGGQGGGQAGGKGGGKGGGGSYEEDRSLGDGQFDPDVLEDGRMRCIYCGRYFSSDRIDKHQGICGKLKSARPKGVDGEPTQTEAKVFDSTAQRQGTGNAFVSPEEYKRRQAGRMRAIQKSKAKTQTNWRRQHAEFQAACQAGRGDPAAATMPLPPRTGMVTCPHCSRQFDRVAADRHIPICAKVENRPKPPPQSRARQVPPTPGPGSTWRGGPQGQSSMRPRSLDRMDSQDNFYDPAESAVSSRMPPSAANSPLRTPGRRGGPGNSSPASSSRSSKLPSGTGWRPSASEASLPRLPGQGGGDACRRGAAAEGGLPRLPGRHGMSASADALRAPQDSTEGPGARAGGRRNMAATADTFRAPEGTPGSAGSSHSRASSGGAGLNAARSLRQHRSPTASPKAEERSSIAEELDAAVSEEWDSDATWKPDMDVTTKQDGLRPKATKDLNGTSRQNPDSRQSATQRMGLRRSALLYRLLSQVPQEALVRELGSCGVEGGSLDQEGLIEAIAQQLS